ncbi:MAG TPA: transketolase C-terminal domain-containing protein [Steroidobacteraceae bacterium]|nr:transketolase C-terminal domain-containing protein [Steroidobacteraceae bacterium]
MSTRRELANPIRALAMDAVQKANSGHPGALAARFNRPGFNIVDHRTYVFAGDGCLMEGISLEHLSSLAVNALQASGRRVRLISMPSTEVFDAQDEAYRQAVLPREVKKRLAVEAGAKMSWWRYVGSEGSVLGIDRCGASGKAADLFPHFGFTADNIERQVRALLAQ